MGKGLTGSRSLQRKPSPDMQGRDSQANLTAGNSRWCNIAEARLSEELGAIISHAEIHAGGGLVAALPTATAAWIKRTVHKCRLELTDSLFICFKQEM